MSHFPEGTAREPENLTREPHFGEPSAKRPL